ncbi:MAG: hypothetical protein HRU38_20940 [Saccharospirillaceae bacterium]|nr:hypothetical protein [Pseudomonadales bacterium]NRB81098.1 hypothetical protein [Saccharospirillaceae bacterium]
MSDLLIPFGIEIDTGETIEPEDSKKGRACNCKCPGCKAPLLSRHSTINRTHFAHDSKHPNAIPENECDFSGAVAVSMMAMEVAKSLSGELFQTVDYEKIHTFDCCSFSSENFVITNKKALEIDCVATKVCIDNIVFDYKLRIGSYRILILFIHRNKPVPNLNGMNTIHNEKIGVLSLNLDSFNSVELKLNPRLKFSDLVKTFILKTGERSWLYHPNENELFNKVINKHECPSLKIPEELYKSYYFECLRCTHKWSEMKQHSIVCPQCHVDQLQIRDITSSR